MRSEWSKRYLEDRVMSSMPCKYERRELGHYICVCILIIFASLTMQMQAKYVLIRSLTEREKRKVQKGVAWASNCWPILAHPRSLALASISAFFLLGPRNSDSSSLFTIFCQQLAKSIAHDLLISLVLPIFAERDLV